MKIIVVNINKALAKKASALSATERAWKLKIDNCRSFVGHYVIGVADGDIKGWFNLIDVHIDIAEPPRVKFDLTPCSPVDKTRINTYINTQGIRLSKIRTKYIL